MAMNRTDKIQNFLKHHINNKKAILGVSGGIDSSLVLMLLKNSIQPDQIMAVFMPEIYTSEKDKNDIIQLENASGIPIKNVYIDNFVKSYESILEIKDKKLLGNIKSRIRMTILYYFANKEQGIVVGTTNLTEYITGYYTKFGDGGCDIEPLLQSTKTDVRSMSKEIGVPLPIIRKLPSAGLWTDQYDERELGFSYDELDSEIEYFLSNKKFNDSIAGRKLKSLYENSAHKRVMPPRPEMDL